jgi:hypothetical protein
MGARINGINCPGGTRAGEGLGAPASSLWQGSGQSIAARRLVTPTAGDVGQIRPDIGLKEQKA